MSGNDAEIFLQGQLTQDITRLQTGRALDAAWCNPKGRVIATMKMISADAGTGLLLPAGIAASVLQRISIYKLRADVQLELAADWQCIAVQSAAALQQLEKIKLLPEQAGNASCSNDLLTTICLSSVPFVVEVFGSSLAMQELNCEQILDDRSWACALIRAGRVRIDEDNGEKYTPHMLSLDLAGAVSFDKGCYTGQEVVARTEHRGRSRRRLARYECESANNAAGDELFLDDVSVGTVVNASGHDVLAVTPVEIHAKTLTLQGQAARPAWLHQEPVKPVN